MIDKFFLQGIGYLIAVSYTHLDVYKRQALHYAQEALDEGLTKQQGHSQEIEPDDAVWLCIDKAQYGLCLLYTSFPGIGYLRHRI